MTIIQKFRKLHKPQICEKEKRCEEEHHSARFDERMPHHRSRKALIKKEGRSLPAKASLTAGDCPGGTQRQASRVLEGSLHHPAELCLEEPPSENERWNQDIVKQRKKGALSTHRLSRKELLKNVFWGMEGMRCNMGNWAKTLMFVGIHLNKPCLKQ